MSVVMDRPVPAAPGGAAGDPEAVVAAGLVAPVVRLRLLGGFELTVDGVPRELTPAAARLVAFLALQGRPLLRSYVAGVLWGDRSDERAGACLRSAVWRANAAHPVIRAARTVLALAGTGVDAVDAADAAHAQLAGAGPVAPAVLSGELLPGWYDDWVVVERERLGQLCLAAMEHMAQVHLERGRWHQAVEAALAVVAAEPLRESAHCLLIEAHTAAGNRAMALRQYEACREVVARELGLEPSAAVRRAADRARHR